MNLTEEQKEEIADLQLRFCVEEMKDKNIEDFEGMNAGAMSMGLAIGAVIGFFIILVVLVKHFIF